MKKDGLLESPCERVDITSLDESKSGADRSKVLLFFKLVLLHHNLQQKYALIKTAHRLSLFNPAILGYRILSSFDTLFTSNEKVFCFYFMTVFK